MSENAEKTNGEPFYAAFLGRSSPDHSADETPITTDDYGTVYSDERLRLAIAWDGKAKLPDIRAQSAPSWEWVTLREVATHGDVRRLVDWVVSRGLYQQ